MYAQVTYFDGPRSPEVVAAAEHAGRDRLQPAIEADPTMGEELASLLVLRRDDGGELVIAITRTEAGIARAREVIMGTELLPDEDPALLSEPSRVEIFQVVESRNYASTWV
ncbi:MAG TPA: hypothetical protein VIG48_00055 [Jatrophihabitans sp.]|jgi:hypothetical protein